MNRKSEIELLADRFPDSNLPGLDFLIELALDLSWCWNHAADEIWEKLDQHLWEMTHNPWIILQTVSFEKISHFLDDAATKIKIQELQARKPLPDSAKWFQENHANSPLTCIAYFSMEYMLSEGLPIYSGGLGNVSGDQLKAANDMGIPVVAIGLLYQQGYFRQVIDRNGEQDELYPYNDPGQLPIMPLRKPNGEWLRLQIKLPGYSVWIRTWEVLVGDVRLFLLDSNDAANFPAHRGITSELYGGGAELRLQQEMVLGIGGWRLLQELNIKPEVCHLNEGHSAFAILERARHLMEETGQSFQTAMAVTRVGNLFTTHTAVAAGFDRFEPWLMSQYLSTYAREELGISLGELLELGRVNPADLTEPFNMAYLAIRGSGAVNGVSALHGKISRALFQPLFPRWPGHEVPVGHVTNGVHMRSWDSMAADDLWTEACGKDRWMGNTEALDVHIQKISSERLWEVRSQERKIFVEYLRRRLPADLAAAGASAWEIEESKTRFDYNTLTLGFARRFAVYKRPNLLLRDPERLLRILTNPSRPVQLVVAGKAHPGDHIGQAMIKEWVLFSRRPEAKAHVVFLSDHDSYLTSQIVQGVDLWINTPRRPWEACGTSGMKVLVNGGINFSELDGWWDEAFDPALGWAIGDRQEHANDSGWDAMEADQIYHLLEREIVPEFYNRNEKGIPGSWTNRMRNSMSMLTPRFSTNRTMIEYIDRYYLPAAVAYKKRAAANGQAGSIICDRKNSLHDNWKKMSFGNFQVSRKDGKYNFRVTLLNDGPVQDDILVELYADPLSDEGPTRIRMNPISKGTNKEEQIYEAWVDASRPEGDFTPRIIPNYESISVPLEDNLILWQR